ncbi:MAG: phosphate-selective porin [Bacteroidota bacterium]|nr:phosphate-selective porin [Bacteroidota bacterium]
MMKKLLPVLLLLICFKSQAQIDGLGFNDDLAIVHPDTSTHQESKLIKILREFRFQAYVQNEWQKADTSGKISSGALGTAGVGAYQGGTFPEAANNRFLLRRGRFKFSFEHKNQKDLKIMEFAFQFDASGQGFTVKDFYGRIIDPWLGWFSIQGGVFLRPFGFETPATPAFFESPEFARVNQTLMPNEVELGEALIIESPSKFETLYLRADATVVNGQGIGVGFQTGTYQSRKDFIGRIKVGKVWNVGKSRLGFNASVSYYNGGVLQTSNYVYQLQKDSTGTFGYVNIADPKQQLSKTYKREYYGAHLEFKADYPIGITTLRGEFIAGIQPGGATSSSIPLGQLNAAPISDLYLRKFNGATFNFTQSFKNKVKNHIMMHDITLKYDWYDPQSQLSGKNLVSNISNGLSQTDIKYSTIGIGYSFIPYNWFKLIIWYDYVMNESTAIPGFTSDYKKDNILTIRTQFYIDTWWFNAKSKYKDNLMLKKY